MFERIIYVSRAAPGTGMQEVFGIIRSAHGGNATAGLSGGLVFVDGWFAQVIEGPPGPLAAAFERIGSDPRHQDLSLRSRSRGFCPLFPGQPMALRTRACLDEAVLEAFGYRPGFPVSDFPADALLEFVTRACRPRPHVGLDRRRAAF